MQPPPDPIGDPVDPHVLGQSVSDPDTPGVGAPPDRAAIDAASSDRIPADTGASGTGHGRTSSARSGRAGSGRVPWWRALLLIGIALAVLVVDVITKVIVVATIAPGENVRILGGLVYLTQIRNAGAAFSMATGMTWLLAIIALAVVAFIVRMAPRMRSTPWAVCLGLILGGALGNLTDRVFRAPGFLQGHVVDFVSVFGPDAEHFPAFNAADSAISIGGVLLVLIALLGFEFDGRRRGRSGAGARGDGGRGDGARGDGGRGDGARGDGDRGGTGESTGG